ncbi:hypothetical protein C9J44_19410 [Photobacterium sp. GB-27]|uniref:DUF4435 domain-containing protein n=1 Tax=Photobacterium sp. GB-27 TaxID=2022109 RepID=UPI000D16E64C|nr:DUF4435 domain-containing protein [Photobacterium sp. GB-27]PSV31846.1 hypothetical protein C9J44_19410 [Photobacterium sp. GB-27]
MLSLPSYNADENLRRIRIEKGNKFLLVEGPFDLPLYESLYISSCDYVGVTNTREVLFGGGKRNILNWLDAKKVPNAVIVLDMDFDGGMYTSEEDNIFELSKYSIENYFFDTKVVSPLLSNIFKVHLDDIENQLRLDGLFSMWSEKLVELIPILFYYQKEFDGDKTKWNNVFLCNNGCHSLCNEQISSFKDKLLDEMNISESTCRDYMESKLSSECCSVSFPGKLLFESFYRYLKSTCNDTKSKSFSLITNPNALKLQLAPNLIKSDELRLLMTKVVSIQ